MPVKSEAVSEEIVKKWLKMRSFYGIYPKKDIPLRVIYKDRLVAKELGARFNYKTKQWYAPSGSNLTLLTTWASYPKPCAQMFDTYWFYQCKLVDSDDDVAMCLLYTNPLHWYHMFHRDNNIKSFP